ncbi:MAG TPA: prolipoprotein diacylglyceryl transferase family protein, partial [Phototrophicaceae bacterium]|nr:prolipoprotein diacylglyceryl transferase family protein [Phototrophicaceae bacterium]
MPTLYTTIGPWTLQTFTLFVAVAVVASAVIGIYRSRLAQSGFQSFPRPGAAADVYLGALFGGVLLARLGHVLLSWDYFGNNLNEVFTIELGGLNWHGAVLGAVIGLSLAARLRRVDARTLLDAIMLALPLIGLAGWWGCLASACGYGLEVPTLADYPPLVASANPDIFGIVAPRFNTQVFGLLLSAVMLALALLLLWRGWLRCRRFWLVLALLSAGMFVIGFYRGDAVSIVAGLRLDQW